VVDFAVTQGQVVVLVREPARQAKQSRSKKNRSAYAVQYYSLDTFSLKRTVPHKRRPVVSAAGVYSLSIKRIDKRRLKVEVFGYNSRGKATGYFGGEWPSAAKKCRKNPGLQGFSSERYYVLIDRCGLARAVDFKRQRVFAIKHNLDRHFSKPAYQLTRDRLLVKGELVNANRGAGDGGSQLYVYDLSKNRWTGRLWVGANTRAVADVSGNDIALVSPLRCANPINSGGDARFVARAPSIVQHLRFLESDAIGKRGAALANAYEKHRRQHVLRRFERFGKDASKILRLQGRVQRPAKRRATSSIVDAIGSFDFGNSPTFRRYLREKRKLTYAQTIRADYACESIAVRTYNHPSQASTGWLSAVIRPIAGHVTRVDGWLANLSLQKMQSLPLRYVGDENPTLPIYERTDNGWVRLSPNGQQPVWVKEGEMGIPLRLN